MKSGKIQINQDVDENVLEENADRIHEVEKKVVGRVDSHNKTNDKEENKDKEHPNKHNSTSDGEDEKDNEKFDAHNKTSDKEYKNEE